MRKFTSLLLLALACGDSASDGGSSDGGSSGGGSTTPTSTATSPTTSAETSGSAGTTATTTSPGSDDVSTGVADTTSSTGAPIGSTGCGTAAVDPTLQWIEHTIDLDGTMRPYWVWLPEPYDPQRAYPVVYQFHGCSDGDGRQNNNPPVQDESGADAIHIRGRATGSCWDTANEGPDIPYFDALVADVEATWCADEARRFATGYSSGSFMTHVLGCVRADMLRGVATIAGGQPGGDCPASVAALLIHDLNDNTVGIAASEAARDDHRARNGCDAESMSVEPAPCVAYTGCDVGYPVVWCQTEGQDHSRQDGLAAPAFWDFLSALP